MYNVFGPFSKLAHLKTTAMPENSFATCQQRWAQHFLKVFAITIPVLFLKSTAVPLLGTVLIKTLIKRIELLKLIQAQDHRPTF